MKKMNSIETIPAQEQRAIMHWYHITLRLFLGTFATLTCFTLGYAYYVNYYCTTCNPCITPASAENIAKKHTVYTTHAQNKKRILTEQQQGKTLIARYKTLVALHNEPSPAAQLTDLQLQPQSVKAQYAITNRSAIRTCLDRLTQSSAVEQASFESLEHNTQGTNRCTIQATWRK